MTFTNQFIKVSASAIVLLLSYVLQIEAFSRTSPISAFTSSGSALYQQVLDVDDDNNNDEGEEPQRPFFFTGEPKSDAENRELQRVFLGAESLRSSAEGTIEQQATAFVDASGDDAISGRVISFGQERENLERLFRL